MSADRGQMSPPRVPPVTTSTRRPTAPPPPERPEMPTTTIDVRVLDLPEVKSLAADLALALALLDRHTPQPAETPCGFDHHGGCQEHGFLSLDPGEKCPTVEAHELLVRRCIREA